MRRFLMGMLVLMVLVSCTKETEQATTGKTLFRKLSPDETGIRFINELQEVEAFDVFRYHNFYNGGGVGIGDFNNDGLADIYLTSNMGENKLYLNKGDWKFEDITQKAGVAGSKFWSTGVSIADVNADGFLDIYVCNAGDGKGIKRENELFINNGDLTFTERASEFGLDDKGYSTHAAFFDYDKDGDLDCYVLNNSSQPVSSLGYRNLRDVRDPFGGHKLYKNDKGKFTDVSEAAGIFGSVIGFGLGVMVGDINQDNWPDLYISNDFYERDYLYINNHDGTFSESLEKYMGHIGMFSMGADLADLNNDGYPEIFSTDMLPFDDYRLKTLTAFETYDVYQLRLQNGYYHQYMRNMLHLNNQDGTFSEIGQLAGVSATDWSWGALIADFNNDLRKEIYVCNGIYKDVTNQDFVEHIGSGQQMRALIEGNGIDYKELAEELPSEKVSNQMFTAVGEMQYKNVAAEWGLADPSFSNGAAYGDLDNDGDLDLVVNNVNQELFVYRNFSREEKPDHFLGVVFKGSAQNPFGLGASIKAYVKGQIVMADHMPIRGFQSSMDYKSILGLGDHVVVDSLVVTWPNQATEILHDIKADQVILLDQANARIRTIQAVKTSPLLEEVKTNNIVHQENEFNDFDGNRLQYAMLSTQGPAFAKADLNGDGLDDFFLGGSAGHPGGIYIQKTGQTFVKVLQNVFDADSLFEDVDAIFFDADGDRDLDLYVVSGGSEHAANAPYLADRIYLNEGLKNGIPQYRKGKDNLPEIYQSGSCVRPVDIDNDGDLDLFVGTRVIPSNYGVPCDQFIWINDGKGHFKDQNSFSALLKKLGMVTDAVWFDYDDNGYKDLVIVGEWMPITLFRNSGTAFEKVNVTGFEKSDGWWNAIKAADLDADGDLDFILGNLGLNSRFKPTHALPIKLYVNDFDQNGSTEPIFTFTGNDKKEYPLAQRPDIIKQMSSFKRQFVYYKDYAGMSVDEIFSKSALSNSTVLNFYEPHSVIAWNEGDKFQLSPLPIQAQVSTVSAMEVLDINNDNFPDIVLGGNFFAMKPEVGRYDALHGLVLIGDGSKAFKALSSLQSGLKIEGEVKHIQTFTSGDKTTLVFTRNNDSLKFFRIR